MKMNKFFQKFGGKKEGDGAPEVRPDPKNLEEEILAEMQKEAEEVSNNMTTEEEVCEWEEEEEEETASTPTPVVPEEDTIHPTSLKEVSNGWSSSPFTVVSIGLVLTLLASVLVFRRKQRRQRRRWAKDKGAILTRVEDVMHQLEQRDEQVDVLQQELKQQQMEAAQKHERLAQESTTALAAKEKECQDLQTALAQVQGQQKETESQLEKVATDLKHYIEAQQDHECQLLEQKLHSSQLSTSLAEAQQQGARLQQKIKADAVKAEQIIHQLTQEKDDRFDILQQENDAIKTTVMGMLKQTQERYDADKVLLKREMRKRDDKIRSLQEELWQSNALVKRLQGGKGNDNTNLIEETNDKAAASSKDMRRSSTYASAEAILEGDGNCEVAQELHNMLQKSSISVDA